MIDLWCEEAGVLSHGWYLVRAETIDHLLGRVIAEAQMVRSDTDNVAYGYKH